MSATRIVLLFSQPHARPRVELDGGLAAFGLSQPTAAWLYQTVSGSVLVRAYIACHRVPKVKSSIFHAPLKRSRSRIAQPPVTGQPFVTTAPCPICDGAKRTQLSLPDCSHWLIRLGWPV